jgi:hypothetical protein
MTVLHFVSGLANLLMGGEQLDQLMKLSPEAILLRYSDGYTDTIFAVKRLTKQIAVQRHFWKIVMHSKC